MRGGLLELGRELDEREARIDSWRDAVDGLPETARPEVCREACRDATWHTTDHTSCKFRHTQVPYACAHVSRVCLSNCWNAACLSQREQALRCASSDGR